MTDIKFSELIRRITPSDPSLLRKLNNEPGLITAPQTSPDYIQPSLTTRHWNEDAHIMLIDAPAATGKTALSENLCISLGWPLIQGNMIRVGNYSIRGLMTVASGFEGSFLKELSAGSTGLVIDALDEAQLKAGQLNFEACLDDIIEISSSCAERTGTRVILLARHDCADSIRAHFRERGCDFADLRLEFFNLNASRSFIAMKVLSGKSVPAALNRRDSLTQPYQELIDQRLTEISSALSGSNRPLEEEWGNVASMLGYPPVLSALAEHISVNNPSKEGPLTARDRTGILAKICLEILQREQSKVESAVYSRLTATLPTHVIMPPRGFLYSPQEQILRLAEATVGVVLSEQPPASLPLEARSEYEALLAPFFADHPFIDSKLSSDHRARFANLLFEDFVRASTITDDPDELRVITESNEISNSPGPFFGRLISHLCGENSILDGKYLHDIIDSMNLEREWTGESTQIAIVSDQAITLLAVADGNDKTPPLRFRSGDCVQLPSRIWDLMVTSSIPIEVSPAGNASIGPDVAITTNQTIAIGGSSLTIKSEPGRQSFIVSPIVTGDALQEIRGNSSDLYFFSTNYPPAFHKYLKQPFEGRRGVRVTAASFMDLRALFMTFGASMSRGLRSCSADKMDLMIVANRPNRQALLNALIKAEVIYRQGSMYQLDLAKLGTLGFSLKDLQANPSEAVLEFLAKNQATGDGDGN